MSNFINFANVAGEVTEVRLDDLGDRKNEQCNVTIYSGGNFVSLRLNNPRKAETNWAERLFDKLARGDGVEVSGSLEEFFYNEQYRRNVRPFVSAKNGFDNSIDIYNELEEERHQATARIAGDVIDIEEKYTPEGEKRLIFTVLYYDTYNVETGENDLSRKEVIKGAIENYKDYAEKTDRDVNIDNLSSLLNVLRDVSENDVDSLVNVYEEFRDEFNPMLFNLSEYTITATDDFAEEMGEIEVLDNITTGVYVINQPSTDEFGFADESESMLKVGKYLGINESLGTNDEEIENVEELDIPDF